MKFNRKKKRSRVIGFTLYAYEFYVDYENVQEQLIRISFKLAKNIYAIIWKIILNM